MTQTAPFLRWDAYGSTMYVSVPALGVVHQVAVTLGPSGDTMVLRASLTVGGNLGNMAVARRQ